ncbi:MAG: uL22 family ribosomal protein [Nanoarchaeota archaeon]
MDEKLDNKIKGNIKESFKEEKISNSSYSNAKQATEVQYNKGDKLDIKKEKTKEKREPKAEIKRIKKTEAVVKGEDLRISTKQAVAVCNFIRNKEIDQSIRNLEKVKKIEIAIPMKGEIPHKKGISIASGRGRYPINAVNEFLKLLKSLRANAIYNELELEKFKIFCMANIASKPQKRFGQGRFKRSHVLIKLVPNLR